MPPEILGPLGLTVAALATIAILWRDHLRSDADDRKERDDWKAIAGRYAEQIPGLTQAVERLTASAGVAHGQADTRLRAINTILAELKKLTK